MKLTKAQRRKIYLEVAEKCLSPYEVFICNQIRWICSLDSNRIPPEMFPELFLFKNEETHAWLSNQLNQIGIESDEEINANKQVVMLLCAEICKP